MCDVQKDIDRRGTCGLVKKRVVKVCSVKQRLQADVFDSKTEYKWRHCYGSAACRTHTGSLSNYIELLEDMQMQSHCRNSYSNAKIGIDH